MLACVRRIEGGPAPTISLKDQDMPLPAPTSRYLERLAETTMTEMGLPALALAVTSREMLLHTAAYGLADLASQTPATASTAFEIGSLGKPFTVIPLLQLCDARELELGAPVSRYLPWFHIQSDFPEITLHHVLNHTSGLPRGTDIGPHGLYESWALRDFRAVAPPGEYFCYSNIGYKTLGFVLESVTGQSLPDVIRERVLEPLEMRETRPAVTLDTRGNTATGYTSRYDDRPEHSSHPLTPATWASYATGDGAQVSTVADMAAYMRMLLNRGQGPKSRLISEGSFHLMTGNGVWTGGDFYSYGLATYDVAGRRYIGHGGGNAGFRSAMVIDMDAGLGVALLTNRMGVTDPLVEVAQQSLTAVRAGFDGGALLPPPEPGDPIQVPDAAAYEGEYRSTSRALSLTADGGRLLLLYDGDTVPLERRGRDNFYVPHPDFALALLEFSNRDGRAVEAFHGADCYFGKGYTGPRSFDHPPEWQAFEGHYRARNPELSNFRIAARKGTLTLLNPWGNTDPLIPMGETRFRIGVDPLSPETLTFAAIADGRALRADYSGCPYYRTFEP